MKSIALIISMLALAAVVVGPCLMLGGSINLAQMKSAMLVATVAWFVATPLWMRDKPVD